MKQLISDAEWSGIYAPYMSLTVFHGWAWTNRPSTARLRKKVAKAPNRYPRFARAIYTDGAGSWPANVLRVKGGRK